jgi:hypothetical protein
MKMPSRIILVIVFFSFLIANCTLQEAARVQVSTRIDWTDLQVTASSNTNLCAEILPEELDTGEGIKRDFTSGLAIGFLPQSLSMPHKIAYDTYWVNGNEPLSFQWLFWYPMGNTEPMDLRLFILLDEKQLTNALPQPGSYNDLQLNRGDDITLPVTIPPLASGIHDIIAVAIALPENGPDPYGTVHFIVNRITLIVEPTPSPPFREIDFVPLPAEGSIQKVDPSMALELTLKNNEIKVWNWPDVWLDVNEKTPVKFFALTGHQDVINVDIPQLEELRASFSSLLLFIDYQQIEISPNQLAIYGKVDKDTAYARIPLTIHSLPQGKHQILVLRIDTPGVPVCILKGDPKRRFLPHSVYGKLVGINVLPSK